MSLLVRARQWPDAERLAAAIEVPSTRFDARLSIARALIQAGEFSSAEAAIRTIDSPLARAQGLVELSERMRAGQAAAAAPADGLQSVTAGLLRDARGLALQADDAVARAAVLRSIAVGFFELGNPPDAHAAMMEAVEALNKAPRFAFTPTPWCATCVAFAKIGDSGWVSRISTGLVQHDAFDGCNALRDLATLARERQDFTQAEAWLAKARESAPKISFYPMRASLRASLAREYARLGKLDQAMQEDLIESRGEALDGIAFALAASGRIADAKGVLAQLSPADEAMHARPALVDALLASNAVDEARAMAGTIVHRSDKGAKLAAVAAALFERDRAADARAVLGEARALARAENARRPDAGVLQQVATVLGRAGHRDEALGLVEEEWLSSATREELVTLTSIADPLVTVVPDLGLRLHEGLDWVEAMMTDGT